MDASSLQKRLERLLPVWQRRLRLQDWAVKVVIAGPHELENDTLADILHNDETKTAVIRFRDEHVVPPGAPAMQLGGGDVELMIEAALVHELLHLHFAPYRAAEEEAAEGIAQHQTIHAVSYALVNLARGRE